MTLNINLPTVKVLYEMCVCVCVCERVSESVKIVFQCI